MDDRRRLAGSGLAPRPGGARGSLGISRGSVREALRRLAGDGLVEFEVNRGFFVADLGLGEVRQRLEARLVLEPEVARMAAGRGAATTLRRCVETIATERAARTSDDVHDASRAFHFAVAGATRNQAFTKLLEGLWIADVGGGSSPNAAGRRTGRTTTSKSTKRSSWRSRPVTAIVPPSLMRAHVESAVRHWSPRAERLRACLGERELDRAHRLLVLGAERLVDLRLQLARGVQLLGDVGAADQLALDEHLRDRRPFAERASAPAGCAGRGGCRWR